jgi:hypothetical protein
VSAELAFSRALLRETISEVAQLVPDYRKAWVHISDRRARRRVWEFHYQGRSCAEGFFDVVSASDAYEARAKGWELFLRKHGANLKVVIGGAL